MKGKRFLPCFGTDTSMECDSSWYQGKGIYGGLVFAYFVQGLLERGAFPIRSLNVELCRPLQEGESHYRFYCMCKGSNTEFWRSELHQDGNIVAFASAVLGGQRNTSYDRQEIAFPRIPAIEKVPPIPKNPIMPAFSQHIEYRMCIGSFPFQGTNSSQTGGWISFRHDDCKKPAVQQVALIDAWWPSMAMNMTKMHYMGTVSFSCHFFAPIAPPYLFVGQTRSIQDGYASEKNALYAADGTIVALAQQAIAIIR